MSTLSKSWICPVCSFMNLLKHEKCQDCGLPKMAPPSVPAKSPSASSVAVASAPAPSTSTNPFDDDFVVEASLNPFDIPSQVPKPVASAAPVRPAVPREAPPPPLQAPPPRPIANPVVAIQTMSANPMPQVSPVPLVNVSPVPARATTETLSATTSPASVNPIELSSNFRPPVRTAPKHNMYFDDDFQDDSDESPPAMSPVQSTRKKSFAVSTSFSPVIEPEPVSVVESTKPPLAFDESTTGAAVETITRLMRQVEELTEHNTSLSKQVYQYKLQCNYDVQSVIDRVLRGDYSALAACRTLESKAEALQLAALHSDPELLLTTIYFLKSSLIESEFLDLLRLEPDACAAFTASLERNLRAIRIGSASSADHIAKAQSLLRELISAHRAFNRPEEAAVCSLRLAQLSRSPFSRQQDLRAAVPALERAGPTSLWYSRQTNDHIRLLDVQMPVEREDAAAAVARTEAVFNQHPRGCILGTSLSALLHYCLMYHPYSPKSHAACPGAIKEAFGVTDKRWMWLLVRARSRVRDWDLIVQNTAKKGFFSSTHESPIGFLPICQALQENGAPIDLIVTYARLISDLEDKVKFCTQIGLYDVAVEGCIAERDRDRLLALDSQIVTKLGPNAPQHAMIQQRLADESKKGTWS